MPLGRKALARRIQINSMKAAETIVRAQARLVRVPVEDAPGDAIQKFTTLELVLVTVTAAAGRSGTGFGYTIGAGGSTILELLRAELLPQLPGLDARHIRQIRERLTRSIHALTPGCIASNALAAIDVALWDLAGKRAKMPLHLLLGGSRDSVSVYNTDVGWLSRKLDEVIDMSLRAVRRDGFRALKLKVGKPDPYEDRERLAKLREAVGSRVQLMADANQAWTVEEAIRRLKLLEEYDLAWIEEPLHATDVAGHERLRNHTRIPLAGGESLYHAGYFAEYVRRGALELLQPDICRIGGITGAMEVAQLASASGLPFATHVSPELSVSLATAVPNCVFVEYLPQMEPVLRRKLRIEDGQAFPFAAAGHGIEFDEEALARWQAEPPAIAA